MNDVAIVGGGAVGACLACLLRADGIAVTLIERDLPEPPAPSAPPDARVVALSRASERVLRAAGAWPALAGARLEPYERMRIWHERQDPAVALTFEAAEVGEPNLGYIAENRLLQAALLGAFRAAGGTLMRAAFTTLTLTPERALIGTDAGEVTARLAVGADGAQSPLRAAGRLTAAPHDYGQSAIVANVASAQPHAHTAWQRFLHDGTLAFLPLFDGTSSIVWSADEPRARALMALGEPAFAAALTEASAGVLGELRLTTPRRALPLQGRAAERYVAERVALIGDAAHVVHPLAGQGVNLGLLDAAALAQEVRRALGSREDPGALAVLRAYERWRKSEVALMASAIDAFDRLLAHGSGPAARIAQAGLTVVNRSAELKRLFIRRALGTSGELPRAAR